MNDPMPSPSDVPLDPTPTATPAPDYSDVLTQIRDFQALEFYTLVMVGVIGLFFVALYVTARARR